MNLFLIIAGPDSSCFPETRFRLRYLPKRQGLFRFANAGPAISKTGVAKMAAKMKSKPRARVFVGYNRAQRGGCHRVRSR